MIQSLVYANRSIKQKLNWKTSLTHVDEKEEKVSLIILAHTVVNPDSRERAPIKNGIFSIENGEFYIKIRETQKFGIRPLEMTVLWIF